MSDRLPVAGPWITEREIEYAARAAKEGWYETAGEFPRAFERAFASYVGSRYAISLPSCTSAIHLALAGLGVGPQDEVIVPELTWIATVAPVQYVGATPVFVDVDRSTWCLSAETVRPALSDRTRAIIAVDLYGNMPDWTGLQALAEERGIPIIEDAAEAIGSTQGGRQAGSFGIAGTFSFHGSKTVTTGEGGMLVTDDEALHDRCRFLCDHGRAPGDRHFRNREVAFKYKMSPVQAALGLAQIERVEELVERKRSILIRYRECTAHASYLEWNPEPDGDRNSAWMSTALWTPESGPDKESVMEGLERLNIDSRPFFHPLSSLPAFRSGPPGAWRERNPVAYDISPRGLNLPSALRQSPEDTERAAGAFLSVLEGQ